MSWFPRTARARAGFGFGRELLDVELRCTHCGEPMRAGDVELLPGPGAGA